MPENYLKILIKVKPRFRLPELIKGAGIVPE
jgi:hypothetical protein